MRFWKCGQYELALGHKTYVMGIVNVSPDSFSGDGHFGEVAVERAIQMIEEGADLLDVGGESTRPGAPPVSLDEELSRVLPIVETLAPRVSVPLSIDTTKAAVAGAALAAGASIVNDISAAMADPQMLHVLAASDCGVVLMHRRGTPQSMAWSARTSDAPSGDLIAEVKALWNERVQAAQDAGVALERIALDAGFGFGKSVEENLELLRRGRELADFGFPVLSGTSRKSTIGKILDDAAVTQRLWGTAATVALAIAGGCDIIRVHDVREMTAVARVADAAMRITPRIRDEG